MSINNCKIIRTQSPDTFEELINSLNSIVGKSISELAKIANVPLPISTPMERFTGEL